MRRRGSHISKKIGSQLVVMSVLRSGRPLPPGRFLEFISVIGSVNPRAIIHLERLSLLKYPKNLWGIEPAFFRLEAQCLNQLRYCVPQTSNPTNLSSRSVSLIYLMNIYISTIKLHLVNCLAYWTHA
jgi:hypothetical protein